MAALQLARDRDAQLLLLHCLDELLLLADGGPRLRIGDREGQQGPAGRGDIAKAAGVPAERRLADMPAQRLGERMAEHARDWKADLIVIGSHGRRGFGRLLLGSGAEQPGSSRSSPVAITALP